MNELYGNINFPQETHVACVFLLDTSSSMNYPENNPPINNLNKAIKMFKEQVCTDEVSKNVIDIAIVEFNSGARVVQDFVPVIDFIPPTLTATGVTDMGQGLEMAIELAKERTKQYQQLGTDAHIPWVIMITDGLPTDDLSNAKRLLEEENNRGKYGHLKLWVIAVEGADMHICKDLTKRVITLSDQDFRPIFDWTRESMTVMSQSQPGIDKMELPHLPENAQIVPDDWVE